MFSRNLLVLANRWFFVGSFRKCYGPLNTHTHTHSLSSHCPWPLSIPFLVGRKLQCHLSAPKTTKIPHSRVRLGGLELYLEDHGWSYHHHHIPFFLIISISCAKLVITKFLLLPSWASFSASHKRITLPRSQESHPIFIFFSPFKISKILMHAPITPTFSTRPSVPVWLW